LAQNPPLPLKKSNSSCIFLLSLPTWKEVGRTFGSLVSDLFFLYTIGLLKPHREEEKMGGLSILSFGPFVEPQHQPGWNLSQVKGKVISGLLSPPPTSTPAWLSVETQAVSGEARILRQQVLPVLSYNKHPSLASPALSCLSSGLDAANELLSVLGVLWADWVQTIIYPQSGGVQLGVS
jgi:hypothetical protein